MEYGVTEQGFILKRFDTILAELQTEVSGGLGFDVSQNPQSMLNSALLYPIADQIGQLWEVAQDQYYAKFPATANGINLDNACQYGSVLREPNETTEYVIHCKGVEGTIIPVGAQIASNTNPQKFLQNTVATTISRDSCNQIQVKVATIDGNNFWIKLNGTTYTYTYTIGDTKTVILTGLMNALPAGPVMAVSDEILTIAMSSASESVAFELSANLTTETVTVLGYYETLDYGAISLPNGTITEIITNVVGLQSVTNKLAPTMGRLQEEDWEYRQSYIKKSYATASKTTDAIQSYLLTNVEDIKTCSVYENYTDTTDADGRPPHSIEAVVDGGEDIDVANALLASRAGGIKMYGSTTVNVTTDRGDTIVVGFSRPEKVYVWLNISITVSGNAPSNYSDLVKESILTEADSLSIGDDVLYQKLIDNVYAVIPNATLCTITTYSSTNPSATPSYSAANVTIGARQVATFTESRITVSAS